MLNESRKILGDPELRLASTCVRVPVEVSHCESVTVEFDGPISVDEARVAIAEFPGITLLDQPHESVYPMPSNSAGEDQVMVGTRPARHCARERRGFLACGRQFAQGCGAKRVADHGRMRSARVCSATHGRYRLTASRCAVRIGVGHRRHVSRALLVRCSQRSTRATWQRQV